MLIYDNPFSILPSKTDIKKKKGFVLRGRLENCGNYRENIEKIIENFESGEYSLEQYAEIQRNLVKNPHNEEESIKSFKLNGLLYMYFSLHESEIDQDIKDLKDNNINYDNSSTSLAYVINIYIDISTLISRRISFRLRQYSLDELKLIISDEKLSNQMIEREIKYVKYVFREFDDNSLICHLLKYIESIKLNIINSALQLTINKKEKEQNRILNIDLFSFLDTHRTMWIKHKCKNKRKSTFYDIS